MRDFYESEVDYRKRLSDAPRKELKEVLEEYRDRTKRALARKNQKTDDWRADKRWVRQYGIYKRDLDIVEEVYGKVGVNG